LKGEVIGSRCKGVGCILFRVVAFGGRRLFATKGHFGEMLVPRTLLLWSPEIYIYHKGASSRLLAMETRYGSPVVPRLSSRIAPRADLVEESRVKGPSSENSVYDTDERTLARQSAVGALLTPPKTLQQCEHERRLSLHLEGKYLAKKHTMETTRRRTERRVS
jgi:hypothetical protein